MEKLNLVIKSLSLNIIILTTIIFGVAKLDAQIIYSDIIPDTIVQSSIMSSDSYFIDFNQDLIYEAEIRHFFPDSQNIAVELYLYNGSEVIVTPSSTSSNFPSALDSGELINNTSNWLATSYSFYLNNEAGSWGNWIGVSNKHLGLRFNISGQWYYGWARVDIDSLASYCIIKDIAYQSTPNTMIVAGDNGLNTFIQDSEQKTIKYKVFTTNKILHIESLGEKCKANILIMNSLGQNILSFKLNEPSQNINLESFPTGIYFVTIYSNRKRKTYKIILN